MTPDRDQQAPSDVSAAIMALPLPPPFKTELRFIEGCDVYMPDNVDELFSAEQLRSLLQQAAALAAGVEGWRPISTAPKEGRTMFVVRGFDVTNESVGARSYTTDPYCVWPGDDGGWVRWPHHFPPTHWMPLSPAPNSQATGDAQ